MPILKTWLPLVKNVLRPFAYSVLIRFGLTAAESATDTLNCYFEMKNKQKDIIKIAKSYKESELLTKGLKGTTENEEKEQKGGFLSMLLRTLGASLLGNLLTGKGTIKAGNRTIRAGYDF